MVSPIFALFQSHNLVDQASCSTHVKLLYNTHAGYTIDTDVNLPHLLVGYSCIMLELMAGSKFFLNAYVVSPQISRRGHVSTADSNLCNHNVTFPGW